MADRPCRSHRWHPDPCLGTVTCVRNHFCAICRVGSRRTRRFNERSGAGLTCWMYPHPVQAVQRDSCQQFVGTMADGAAVSVLKRDDVVEVSGVRVPVLSWQFIGGAQTHSDRYPDACKNVPGKHDGPGSHILVVCDEPPPEQLDGRLVHVAAPVAFTFCSKSGTYKCFCNDVLMPLGRRPCAHCPGTYHTKRWSGRPSFEPVVAAGGKPQAGGKPHPARASAPSAQPALSSSKRSALANCERGSDAKRRVLPAAGSGRTAAAALADAVATAPRTCG